jgi:plasmid stability protein
MAQLIVRNLDEAVKRRLKWRASRDGRSMEEEVRHILRDAVRDERYARRRPAGKGRPRKGFGTEVAELFRGIELEEPIPELRGYSIKPVKFD